MPKRQNSTIYFVTSNRDKFKEAALILREYGIPLRRINFDFKEIADSKLENIVIDKAQQVKKRVKKSFIVDEAGIFFKAYKNFPGALTKNIYASLGYNGILRLLDGKNRAAYFKTVIAYGGVNKGPFLFEGFCRGAISEKLKGPHSSFSPFNRLFIPRGGHKTFAQIGIQEEVKSSHRRNALKKFAKFYLENVKKGE